MVAAFGLRYFIFNQHGNPIAEEFCENTLKIQSHESCNCKRLHNLCFEFGYFCSFAEGLKPVARRFSN